MTPILTVVSHYHHRRMTHPRSHDLTPGRERIELMTAGRGWIIHNGEFREVLPGDLVWQSYGDRTICKNDPDNPYVCLSLHFTVDANQARPVPRVTRWNDKTAIQDFIKETIQCFHDDQFDRHILSQYVYGRLLFQAKRHLQNVVASDVPRQLKSFIDLIEGQFKNPLSIDVIAQEIGWSVAHLHDQCRSFFDESPLQLLLRQRINHAKELLCSHRDTIKSIAHDCGFNSSSHFCRSFKQNAGMSPEQFRRSYWGG